MIARAPMELFPDGQALHEGIIEAAEKGYAFVPHGVDEWACAALEAEAGKLQLELGDHVRNPIYEGTKKEITQLHERAYLPVGDPNVPFATFVTRALHTRIAALRYRYPCLNGWMASEAGYQLYRDPDHHISKHRDRRNDELLAATITIRGSAVVGIHEAIDDPDDYTNTRQVDECVTEGGTIMFLRAQGVGNGEQVIHDVSGPIDGPRLILNLRQRPNVLPSPLD